MLIYTFLPGWSLTVGIQNRQFQRCQILKQEYGAAEIRRNLIKAKLYPLHYILL